MSGNFYYLLIWHKDSISIEVPLEHRNHNFALAFRPIALEAAQEIERQVNEHIASRQYRLGTRHAKGWHKDTCRQR